MNAETRARISEGLLPIARWLVAALAIVAAAGNVAGIILFPAYASAHVDTFTLSGAWTPAMMAAAAEQLGWSPLSFPWAQFTHDLVSFFVTSALGLIILWRGPRTWFGVFVALTFVSLGYASSSLRGVAEAFPPVGVPTQSLAGVAWQFLFILFYVFPDGRFVPHWTRWLLVPWVFLNLPFMAPVLATDTWSWLPIPLVLSAIASQVYRYFWRSGPVERAQTKWVVYAVACVALVGLAFVLAVPMIPRAPAPAQLASLFVSTLAWQVASWASGLLLPIAFAVAILRHHLWDVDLVIRRTLVYAMVSLLLALVFYGTVLLSQRLFTGITGQASPVAVVGSTLLIAALFSPLRRRVQNFVDRRFYRRKYNAQQILAQFGTIARDETDLDRLAAGLEQAVNETMRPTAMGVWLARN